MRRTIVLVAAVMMLSSLDAAAAGPQIVDMAGDANGLDAGIDTRPASHDPADLLSVRLSTEHEAVPVGEDGIDYQERALLVTFATLAGPIPEHGTLAFALRADLGTCSSSFMGMVDAEGGSPVMWTQFGQCPDVDPGSGLLPVTGSFAQNDRWTTTVGDGSVTLRIPFESLTIEQAAFLRPGAVAAAPSARSMVMLHHRVDPGVASTARLATLDTTAVGASFTIGEDVPEDVPCTRGCP